MISVWSEQTKLPQFSELQKDISTDVLVIGGGLAGLLCARLLTDAGVNCVLAEQNRICSGVTKNTTAKITAQHGLIYDNLIQRFGENKAMLYFKANQQAVEDYAEMCKNIDCGFERRTSYVYTLKNRQKIENEVTALKRLGAKSDFVSGSDLPIDVMCAVSMKSQAQFQPLAFVSSIVDGLHIFENTQVLRIDGHTAVTHNGKINAKNIIVATHFPFINKHGLFSLKMYQQRSYVIAVEGAEQTAGMYVDEAQGGISLRSYGNLLLIGGAGARTGKPFGGWEQLRSFAADKYPEAKEKYHWATQDCMTLDEVPYIGAYSPNTPRLYVATGFNKWGMTSSMVAAKLLRDMILGKENELEAVFNPQRSMLRKQLLINGFEYASSLLAPSLKRCPHLGCHLKWNSAEHSWDCPCHGSRFSEDGELLDNPATGDLHEKE
ncbi:MAG: FAD-dependent oxidoreductase [Clostridia bacterium]|nr:FAD-dependent oxidoreductase [Clostridia bacterium]